MRILFLRFAVRVFQASLVLYPREFRQRYGADMAEVFRHAMEDALSVSARAAVPIMMDSLRDALSIALPGLAMNPLILTPVASMVLTSALFSGLLWSLANPLKLNSMYHALVRIFSP